MPKVSALRRRRHDAGLSIRDLELATGINRGRLSYLERGIEPTPAELEAIDTALNDSKRATPA